MKLVLKGGEEEGTKIKPGPVLFTGSIFSWLTVPVTGSAGAASEGVCGLLHVHPGQPPAAAQEERPPWTFAQRCYYR